MFRSSLQNIIRTSSSEHYSRTLLQNIIFSRTLPQKRHLQSPDHIPKMFSKHLFFAAMAFTSLVSEVVASDYQGGLWFCRPAPSIRELRRSYGSLVAQCPTLNAQDPDDQRTYCANACAEFCTKCPTSNAKASAVGCFITTVEEGTKLTRCFCGGAYGSKNPPGCQ